MADNSLNTAIKCRWCGWRTARWPRGPTRAFARLRSHIIDEHAFRSDTPATVLALETAWEAEQEDAE